MRKPKQKALKHVKDLTISVISSKKEISNASDISSPNKKQSLQGKSIDKEALSSVEQIDFYENGEEEKYESAKARGFKLDKLRIDSYLETVREKNHDEETQRSGQADSSMRQELSAASKVTSKEEAMAYNEDAPYQQLGFNAGRKSKTRPQSQFKDAFEKKKPFSQTQHRIDSQEPINF